MKTLLLKSALGAAILSLSATAFAYSDTAYFKIDRLEASSSSASGFRIYPSGYALPTTEGCTRSDFAEVQVTGPLTAEKRLMQNTLLSAFLSGRSVKLRLDGCGANDRPAYRVVTVDSTR